MRVLVVGYGSIGERHARILSELGCQVSIVSRHATPKSGVFRDLAQALSDEPPGYIVIANETCRHRNTLDELIRLGYRGSVLVEKPLFDCPLPPPDHKFARLAVAYNLRFHPTLLRLRDILAQEKAIRATVHCGSYLPDWRPGRDYRAASSAAKAAGGGVLRDLSHEIDYLLWLLGPWNRLAALGGKLSPLEIETDDVFSILVELDRCLIATVSLDYLDRRGRREITINTASGTVAADLIAGTLSWRGTTETFSVARDDTYRAQHKAMLANEPSSLCDFAAGLAVVEFIAAAESAAKNGRWIQR